MIIRQVVSWYQYCVMLSLHRATENHGVYEGHIKKQKISEFTRLSQGVLRTVHCSSLWPPLQNQFFKTHRNGIFTAPF